VREHGPRFAEGRSLMSSHAIVLFFHVLGATVWTGGHLVLAVVVLPRALRARAITELQTFESNFERIGIPALLTQIITGVWLATDFLPVSSWFELSSPLARAVLLKLGLLACTALLAVDARLRIIPRLTPEKLGSLAFHIIPVTVLSVLFVLVGVLLRSGGV
jgi:putative copper export protein